MDWRDQRRQCSRAVSALRVAHAERVDRVLAYEAKERGAPQNPAAREALETNREWLYAHAESNDQLPLYLSGSEARVLVNYLSSGHMKPTRAGLRNERSWQMFRNRAAVAMHLGAGLTPLEVRALRIDDVIAGGGPTRGVPWKLHVKRRPVVRGNDPTTSLEREAPIAQWAGKVLARWLEVRNEILKHGDYVFPSTATGKPWSKMGHNLAVRETLSAAEICSSLIPGGAFRLRHTFALRQLRRGRSKNEVARWLGIADVKAMDRYDRIVIAHEALA